MKLKNCCIKIFQKYFNVGDKTCLSLDNDLKYTITKFAYKQDENGKTNLWMHATSDRGYKSAYNLKFFYNKFKKVK